MRKTFVRVCMALLFVFTPLLSGCAGNMPESDIVPLESNSEGDLEESVTPQPTENSVLQTQEPAEQDTADEIVEVSDSMLLYQGHASLRITTAEGKVIYIDPYAGEGYDLPADLILVTHGHSDHNEINRIETKNQDCVIITHEEALVDGVYKIFEFDFATVEAVQAGNNRNHNIKNCVGYIITLNSGKSIYISGDTSTTEQMATLAARNLDYAFFCCDGIYNMNMAEALSCAALVQAKHSIPYHMIPGDLFSQELAESFVIEGVLLLADGEEIPIV